VKCGGRCIKSASKKKYIQSTADAQTSTLEKYVKTAGYKYSRCTDIDFRLKSRCIDIDSRVTSSIEQLSDYIERLY
jgi:hypothetical protein